MKSSTDEPPATARARWRQGPIGDRPPATWAVRAVVSLPDRLLVVFLWFAIAVAVTLVLRVFEPAVVLPLALILVVATWRVSPRAVRADQRSAAGAALAVALASAWLLLNRRYDSTMESVYRDPAIFTLRAWWLVHHHSPNIPVGSALQVAKSIPAVTVQTGGFPDVGGVLEAQNNSLVPGLVAVAGWVGGYSVMLAANLVYGALGLVGVYAVGRRLLGPLWALAPMVALAASMPMVVFSRAPYTEPTALIMVMGGLTVLWSAWETRRLPLFVLAGLFVGASSLARPDGGVAVLGASAALVLVAVTAVEPTTRRVGRLALLAFAAGAAVMMAFGWLDLRIDSRPYLDSTPQVRSVLEAFPVVVVMGLALSWLRGLGRPRAWLLRRRRGLAVGVGVAGALAAAVMISRPAWWVAREVPRSLQPEMAGRQAAAHLRVDPARSYDERTMDWLAWYYEWPTVLLGCAGGALLLWVAARRRDPRALVVVATVGAVAALYLNDVSIFPDQIWGSRRFLPVVIPGMLIAAVFAARLFSRRFPNWSWLGVGLAGLVAVLPLYTWGLMFPLVQGTGQPAEVAATCQAVAGSRVVLAGPPRAGGSRLPTLRVICGVSVVAITAPTAAQLAQVYKAWGGGRIAVISGYQDAVPWATPPLNPYYQGNYGVWEESLQHRPRAGLAVGLDLVYAGVLDADGRVDPTSPPAA